MAHIVEQMKELADALEVAKAEIAEKDKALAAATALLEQAMTEAESVKQSQDAALAELAAEKAAHEATAAELKTAKEVLANPAHNDAKAQGEAKATAEGGVPVTEEVVSREQAIAAYNALPDGMEGAKMRAEFRAKYKDILGL